MPNQQSPSIDVTERPAEVVTIEGTPTSIGGFAGKAQRGPVGKPIAITSVTQFKSVFGGAIADSYLYESVDAFFKNGGSLCFVSRVAHYSDITDAATLTATPATCTLTTGTGAPATSGESVSGNAEPFDLEPGQTLDIIIDGGAPLTATFSATAAGVTSGAADPFALANGQTLTVRIDGGVVQTITFSTGQFSNIAAATAEEVAAAINSSLVGGAATVIGGEQVRIISDRRGSGSSVQVTGGTSNATLTFSTSTVNGTGNVSDINAVTAAEAAAVIDSALTGYGSSTANADDEVVIVSDTDGLTSTVQVVNTSTATAFGFDNAIHAGTDSTATTDTLVISAASPGAFGNNYSLTATRNDQLYTTTSAEITSAVPISSLTLVSASRVIRGDTLKISDGVDTVRVVVTDISGNRIYFESFTPSVTVSTGATVTCETFSIACYENGRVINGASYSNLRMSPLAGKYFVENAISSTDDPTRYFSAASEEVAPTGLIDPRPTASVLPGLTFSGGSNGGSVVDTDYVGSPASKTGLYAFANDNTLPNMISIPGQTSVTCVRGLQDFVAQYTTVSALFSLPFGTTPQGVPVFIRDTANLSGTNLVPCYNWVKVNDVLTGATTFIPNDGFVQGRWARVAQTRNIAKAPAGTLDGRLVGAIGVERDIDRASYDLMYGPANVNALIVAPEGFLLFGSRTLGAAGELTQVAKRRVMNYAIRSIRQGTRWILFENNDTATRARWSRSVQQFCKGMWEAGMLDGNTPEEAYYVICDETNNPPSVRQAGKFVGRIGLRFKDTIEFADYEFEEDLRDVISELSGAGA